MPSDGGDGPGSRYQQTFTSPMQMHFNPSTPNVWHGAGRLLAPNRYERTMIDNSLSLFFSLDAARALRFPFQGKAAEHIHSGTAGEAGKLW